MPAVVGRGCAGRGVGGGGGVEELAGENELFEIRRLEKVGLGVVYMGRGPIRAHHGPKSARM